MSSSRHSDPLGNTGRVSPADVIRSGLCIGCGACVARAQENDVHMGFDRFGQWKPRAGSGWMRDRTADFSRICPFSPDGKNEDVLAEELFPNAVKTDPQLGRLEATFVGHVAEGAFRAGGSSGGMVTWVATELLRKGLLDAVAHVVERSGSASSDERLFSYTISRDPRALQTGAKSRYYPVEMSGVIEEIRRTPGRYAVVGIPCFIKALRLLSSADPILKERIAFTLGLVCGHMKSARMTESFSWQMGQRIQDVERIDYRSKSPDRPASWYRASLGLRNGELRARDWWNLVDGDWGAGFFQNSACNYCDDVVAETADISFGDAWQEPYSSDWRGTNVVIVRSRALLELIGAGMESGRICLSPADEAFVVSTQAAGFRQRREGLAFRMSLPRFGIRPGKRVAAVRHGLGARRKMIYGMRLAISFWSHRVFWLAREMHWPGLYLGWARLMLSCYHALAYSRGPMGRLLDRFCPDRKL
ncbi:Coenzyme F420 hydrogenase/dehydrogenase, beta subunit C-terminal domain [Rhizobium sp. ERR 1071]|uniref:Coenzyme F420 hydrogenase/dehydrogenase, beta subunit C-terminal domain n=1 Tax=Rhizobium sp. ERR 1071 TaxID=2572677 RepID=UPI001FED9B37|nr:Coenzyme F420 hydrogenase/dehydrogenase, beta subunit C-terminal domain [Rhizobium sp. ERR1071]